MKALATRFVAAALAVATLLAVALSASAADPAAVVLTSRASDISSNAGINGATPDAEAAAFAGPGNFSDTVDSTHSASNASGGSASSSGRAQQDSTVFVNSGGLTVEGSTTLNATASATGDNFPGSPMTSAGLGDDELDVSFQVQGAPHSYSLDGTRSVPQNGHVEIELDGPDGPVFEASDTTGGGFSQSGTLPVGSYTLTIDAEALAEDNAAGAVPSSNGGYDITLLVGEVAPEPVPVTITSGPSGTTPETSAQFGFQATNPNPPAGRFQCSLDGSTFSDCASPKAFTGLADGEHVFQVRYAPNSGDPGPVTERRWRVATTCPDVRVGLAVAKGCFTERQANGQGTGVFETESDAWLGGFHLRPRSGGKLVVQDRPENPVVAEGAGVDWVLDGEPVPAPLSEIKPFLPTFDFSLFTGGTLERFLKLPLVEGLGAQLKVTWADGGSASKVEASVSIEELTKNLGKPLAGRLGLGGTSVGTLAGKLVFTFVNGRAAEVTEGELELPEFAVELAGTNPPIKEGFGGGKLKARRVGGVVEWSGEVKTLFPWQGATGPNQGAVTGRLFLRDSALAGLGLAVSGFEQAIGRTGWDITGLEGDVIYNPRFALNVGVQGQRRLSSAAAAPPLLKLTGNVKALALAAPDCGNGSNPYEFVGTFNAPEVERLDIGEFKGQLQMCAYLQGLRNFAFEAGVSGELNVKVDDISKLILATGSARGWFSGSNFNLDGAYQLRLPVLGTIGASGVLSSEGYAVCGQYGFISAGVATNNWLEPPESISGCDFTPFRAAATAASAAGAAGTETVRIPPGQTAFGMAIHGSDAAPRVRIGGPRGERFTSPAPGEDLKAARVIAYSIEELDATYVYLRAPRAGSWRVEPLGGASIERVETQRQLPQPRVRARVRRVRGGKLVVDWRARRIPGQRIELIDRAEGSATTIQRATRRRRGRVAFKPANPLATRRTIEAAIVQDGRPRPAVVAARYRLAKPKRPARVRGLTARRVATGLVIRWRKAARARDYLVTVNAGPEVLTRSSTAGRTLTYAGAPAGALEVRVTPRDRFGRAGRTGRLAVR